MSSIYRSKTKTKSTDLINRPQIFYHISLMKCYKRLRDPALFAFLYLTATRISECVKSIRKYDIDIVKMHGTKFMVIYNVKCLKRKKGNEAKRNIAINIEKEVEFIKLIYKWLDKLKEDDYIFDISRKHAYKIVRRWYDPAFPHYLRHLRLTHLATNYGFNSADLRQFTGWSSDIPAAHYVHLNWKDVAKKMI